jgi:hypothetical protein
MRSCRRQGVNTHWAAAPASARLDGPPIATMLLSSSIPHAPNLLWAYAKWAEGWYQRMLAKISLQQCQTHRTTARTERCRIDHGARELNRKRIAALNGQSSGRTLAASRGIVASWSLSECVHGNLGRVHAEIHRSHTTKLNHEGAYLRQH